MTMDTDKRLAISLFLIRITVFLVMFMWTLRKYFDPVHAGKLFAKYYAIPGLNEVMIYGIVAVQMVLIFAFLFGIAKFWTYGLVMVLHGGSTFAPLMKYFAPYEGTHLLFFAAWPMLAACITLFLLRDKDTMFVFKAGGSSADDGAQPEKEV
ncbi:MAG: hypothetical protein L3J58_01850 [Emcibacter sp.]|nr:hypothetical protein [Emcibacter sp.]